MGIAIGITFLGVGLVLIVFVLLAIMRTGLMRLDSSAGIWGDGLPRGKSAPPWSLPDVEGYLRVTPAGDHWQLLIFTNHSLVSFPDLIAGMHHLAQAAQELEVLVLTRGDREYCASIMRGLNLQVPVVPVEQVLYDRYRVRVMPFATLLDPQGITRWVGLVNTKAQLFHTWHMIRATVQEDSLSRKEAR